MSKFIIQCENINGNLIPMFDFGYELIQAIKYQNWFRREQTHEFVLVEEDSDVYADYIPIGSIEFVSAHMKKYDGVKEIHPINIPEELYPFAKRFVQRVKRPLIWKILFDYEKLFIKDDDKIKGFSGICSANTNLPICNYLVSEVIDIQSEWRCFVKDGHLLDIKCYSGDFEIMPDIKVIDKMIADYKDCPPAYTLDVAINDKNETVIIECHNFFSCGLYGFNDYQHLPAMFVRAYKWEVNRCRENNPNMSTEA